MENKYFPLEAKETRNAERETLNSENEKLFRVLRFAFSVFFAIL